VTASEEAVGSVSPAAAASFLAGLVTRHTATKTMAITPTRLIQKPGFL